MSQVLGCSFGFSSASIGGAGGVTGSGTPPKMPVWTGAGELGDSQVSDNGTSVFIGASSTSVSALFEVKSTTQGALFSRMTTAERDLIPVGVTEDSLFIYNTSSHKFQYYDSSAAAWITIESSVIGGETWSGTLTNGAASGGVSPELSDGDVLKSVNGGSQLNLRAGANGSYSLSSDAGTMGQSWLFGNTAAFESGFGTNKLSTSATGWDWIDNVTNRMNLTTSGTLSVGDVTSILGGDSKLDLRRGGVDSTFALSGNRVKIEGITNTFNVDAGTFGADPRYSNFVMGVNGVSLSLIKSDFTRFGGFAIGENDTSPSETAAIPSYPVFFSAQSGKVNAGIFNTSITSGINVIGKTSNTTYANQYGFNTGLAGQILLKHTPNTGDFIATLQAKTGTLAYLSDVTAAGYGGIYNGSGSLNGATNVTMSGNNLTFSGGQTTFKGSGATSATTSLLVENSAGTNLLVVKDNGEVYSYGQGGVSTNTAFGFGVFNMLTTGDNNTAIGHNSGSSLTSGDQNTLVGRLAGNNLTTGFNHTFIGYNSGAGSLAGQYNVAIGYSSMTGVVTGSSNIVIGERVGASLTSGSFNIILGVGAANTSVTGTFSRSVLIGSGAGASQTGSYTTAIGQGSGARVSGYFNTSLGYASLGGASGGTTGVANTAIGERSGNNITSGASNTYAGQVSGFSNKTGNYNVGIGLYSEFTNVSGSSNTSVGYQSNRNGGSKSSTVNLGAYAGNYETQSNTLFIDNQHRSNEVLGRANSMIYGIFHSTVTSQYLTFNANVGVGTQASARLHIKGSGATSATTSILVRNSSGLTILEGKDNGLVSLSDDVFQVNKTPFGNKNAIITASGLASWGVAFSVVNTQSLGAGMAMGGASISSTGVNHTNIALTVSASNGTSRNNALSIPYGDILGSQAGLGYLTWGSNTYSGNLGVFGVAVQTGSTKSASYHALLQATNKTMYGFISHNTSSTAGGAGNDLYAYRGSLNSSTVNNNYIYHGSTSVASGADVGTNTYGLYLDFGGNTGQVQTGTHRNIFARIRPTNGYANSVHSTMRSIEIDMGLSSTTSTANDVSGLYLRTTAPSGSVITNLVGLDIDISNSGTVTNQYAALFNGGNVGFGVTSPTANVHIGAGTATSSTAPLKLTTGTLNAVAETGAMEFASDFFYLTANSTRTAISTFGRTVDNLTTYTALITDRIIGVTRTATGIATINLPSAALYPSGYQLTIMDEGLNASTFNIIIDGSATQTINGNLTEIINVDGDSRTIYSNGVDGWFIM